jgi:hypothetical protein
MFIARCKRGLGGDWMKFGKVSVPRRRGFFLGRGFGGAIIALAATMSAAATATAVSESPMGADMIQAKR